jgi:catechol 2,3-dioxygenase-like lactoylglutathione lyase family enzyme
MLSSLFALFTPSILSQVTVFFSKKPCIPKTGFANLLLEMNQPILELRVAITTSDYEKLTQFYCQGLGLEPSQLWVNDHDKALLLELGQATIEIFDEPHAEIVDNIEVGAKISGSIRFALKVDDVETAMAKALAHGATLIHPPVITPWNHKNVRLCDPDGMQITLFQVM